MALKRSPLQRAGALVASAALATTGLTLFAAPAYAIEVDPRPVNAGAAWLTDQLVGGIVKTSYLDDDGKTVLYDDLGLTMDTAMSLVAVGGRAATVATIKAALEPRITETYDNFGTTYTGSAAKAAVYTALVGGDPENVGGTDLVAVVEANTAAEGVSAGRISNVNDTFGDTNTFGQAFAVRALAAAGSGLADEAEAFLLKQQCAAGFFRLNPTDPATAEDQTCEGAVGSGASAPDTDATSIAVLQLDALANKSEAVLDALGDARAWLLEQQKSDGSFGGGPSTSAPNANSTGLAGQALAGPGVHQSEVTAAALWVRSRQADEPSGCPNGLSGEAGALGYNNAAVAAARKDGITGGTRDRWLRTSAPVLPVLMWAPAGERDLFLRRGLAPGFVRGGTTAPYRALGVVPGDKVCTTGLGVQRTFAGAADGTAFFSFRLPDATGVKTITVSDRTGAKRTDTLKVLGTKTLAVTSTTPVVGSNVRVRVAGLYPGEKVSIWFRGVPRVAGTADANGEFVRNIGVTGSTGLTTISAFGQFADIRKGYKIVRVVS